MLDTEIDEDPSLTGAWAGSQAAMQHGAERQIDLYSGAAGAPTLLYSAVKMGSFARSSLVT